MLAPAPPSFVIILNVILISLIFLIILCSNSIFYSTISAFFFFLALFQHWKKQQLLCQKPKGAQCLCALPWRGLRCLLLFLLPPHVRSQPCLPLRTHPAPNDSHSCPGTHKAYHHCRESVPPGQLAARGGGRPVLAARGTPAATCLLLLLLTSKVHPLPPTAATCVFVTSHVHKSCLSHPKAWKTGESLNAEIGIKGQSLYPTPRAWGRLEVPEDPLLRGGHSCFSKGDFVFF